MPHTPTEMSALLAAIATVLTALTGLIIAVFVQARLALCLSLAQRPLLRCGLQQGVAHAGDVQVAPARAGAVFVPDGFGLLVRKQALAAPQALRQPARQVNADRPVVPCLAWRRRGRPGRFRSEATPQDAVRVPRRGPGRRPETPA